MEFYVRDAFFTVEARDYSGSRDLSYAWDLDTDGIYETDGGAVIELLPETHFYRFSAAVKVTDNCGRSTEGLFSFYENEKRK